MGWRLSDPVLQASPGHFLPSSINRHFSLLTFITRWQQDDRHPKMPGTACHCVQLAMERFSWGACSALDPCFSRDCPCPLPKCHTAAAVDMWMTFPAGLKRSRGISFCRDFVPLLHPRHRSCPPMLACRAVEALEKKAWLPRSGQCQPMSAHPRASAARMDWIR
jgi:hypothetical protein